MSLNYFGHGLVLGLSIAAVIGPMSILCIQRTLISGYLYGLVSGFGIATADGLYSCLGGFGLTILTTLLLRAQIWVHLAGGLFLLYLGLKGLLRKPEMSSKNVGSANYIGAYVSTLLLTLTNPLTILSFAAIFAGIGLGSAGGSYLDTAFVVGGVFSGSLLWWLILCTGVSFLRAKVTPTVLLWVNRFAGIIIATFGLLALFSL